MVFDYTANIHVQNPGKQSVSGACVMKYAEFQGADIKGFNAKLGVNGQESELTLDLVESIAPPDAGEIGTGSSVPPYDQNAIDFHRSVTQNCQIPGYSGILGHAYTVSVQDNNNNTLTFHGILQDHDIKMDNNGKTISARLTDGRQYLNNVTIIANKYYSRNNIYDKTGSSKNILNILYEAEKGVAAQFDDLGATGFAKCDYFMDSGADKDGIPAVFILGQFMTTRYLTLPLSNQTIAIDISDIFNLANQKVKYLRIPETSINLLNLIETVCSEAASDFYVYMDKDNTGYKIFVKHISRAGVPNTTLRDYMRTLIGGSASKTLSYSYGQEATYENTRNIVFGNNYRYFVEINYDLQSQIFNGIYSPNGGAGTWNGGFFHLSSTTPNPNPQNLRNILLDQQEPIKTLDYSIQSSGDSFASGNNSSQFSNNVFQCSCGTLNGGGRIAMVLGEKLNVPPALTVDGIPTHKIYLSNLTNDSINIEYDISDLCAMLGITCPGSVATLTQDELLFSETYESYFNWALAHPNSIGYVFGSAIFGALWTDLQKNSLKIFADIVDNGSFDSFKDPAIAYPDTRISSKLFEVVHQYVKDIYNNYYGQEYIVLLDRNLTNDFSRFDICLGKSYNTWSNLAVPNTPSSSPSTATIPTANLLSDLTNKGVIRYAIKTAGRNGYISASDYVVNGAWFAGMINNVLGLDANTGLSIFLNDDNTIGGFVKYGAYEKICKIIGGKVWSFRVDFSEMDPGDYVIYNETLYLRAQFSEEVYFAGFDNSVTDNTWVRFRIPRVKLVPDFCTTGALGRAASRLALIALSVMTDLTALSGVTEGTITLEDAIKDKLAGGGINAGVWDGIASNLSAVNLAKISTPATVPYSVAIPMESATMIYGPWTFTTNPSGATNVIEYDLNPWSFGFGSNAHQTGWINMVSAGNTIATNGSKGRTYQEKGSFSIVGIPNMTIGKDLNGFSAIDQAMLTDINFSYGSNGAVTSMNFQTYSPKFGSAPKYLVDTAKETIANKLEYMKQFREYGKKERATAVKLREEISKLSAGLGGGGGGNIENANSNASNYGHTPAKMLMGGYLNKNDLENITNNTGGNGTDNTTSTTHNYTDDRCEAIDSPPFPAQTPSISNDGNKLRRFVSTELQPSYNFDHAQSEYYKNMSYMSLDGLFLPISIAGGPNTNLVRYSHYTAETAEGILPKDRPIHAMPPVSYDGTDEEGEPGVAGSTFDLRINQKYLNPIVSEGILSSWGTRKNDSTDGFVIVNIAHGSQVNDNFNFDDIKNLDGSTFKDRQTATDFRFHALRGPLVLQSWGYDINGKPIPNSNDSAQDAEAGNFRNVNLQDKFLKNWLGNPKTWPVGPIDLRWDRHRGVWVSPPSSKLIVARMRDTLSPYGTAQAELLNPISGDKEYYQDYALYGENGENLKADVRTCTVTVHEYLGSTIAKCAMVLLHYEDGKYIVVNEGSNQLQRARIGTGQTLTCGGQCKGELFMIGNGGGLEYGDPNSINISDTVGLVSQALPSQTRLWVIKTSDSDSYEVVYIGTREDAGCGSCGGEGVYSIAGVDFARLPVVQTVGAVLTVTEGGCLALVGTAGCANITSG